MPTNVSPDASQNLAEMQLELAGQHLLRMLTLSSTALPIGAYCYSQGVEAAIEAGLVTNEASALEYFNDVLEFVLVRAELPWLRDLAYSANDPDRFTMLSQRYIAMRESREFLQESRQLAYSLHAWMRDLPVIVEGDEDLPNELPNIDYGFLPMYSWLVHQWKLPLAQVLSAYAVALLENQVLAVVKTLPLGQMGGQRILWKLQQQVPAAVTRVLAGQQISSSLPKLALLSAQHEQQYSRLFRS
jgi:urease accessory protein